jgi:hypothetical protein
MTSCLILFANYSISNSECLQLALAAQEKAVSHKEKKNHPG